MPVTFWTFTIAVAAISGLPGLAGFFSKDAILSLAYMGNPAIFAVLAVTAVLTAFYMLRLWKITFLGSPRSDEASHAHEGGIALTAPLVLLAALSVVGGYLKLYPAGLSGALASIPEAAGRGRAVVFGTSLLVLAAGAGAALAFYTTEGTDALERASPGLFAFLTALRTSFDRVYDAYVAKVQQRVAIALNFIDIVGIAGACVRGLAGVVEIAGAELPRVQTGRLNTYVYWFLGGVAVLWALAAGIL